jgi:flagella basal body P-ring formation protein FlgA
MQVNLKKGQPVVVARRDLSEGTVLSQKTVELVTRNQAMNNQMTRLDDVVGATLLDSVAAGSPLTSDNLEFYATQFQTLRAYAPGDVIDLADLSVESAPSTDQNSLSQWPRGQVIATRQLAPGHRLNADDIEAAISAVVAKENIIRNQVITPDLVTHKMMGGAALGAKPLTDLDAVIGFEATRTIQAGSMLNASDLRAADLVREGENVTLTIKKGALSITVDTLATEDAKMAEQVILINPESGREIRGIVTGRNQARGL